MVQIRKNFDRSECGLFFMNANEMEVHNKKQHLSMTEKKKTKKKQLLGDEKEI